MGQKAQIVDLEETDWGAPDQDICLMFRDGQSLWVSPERLLLCNPDLVIKDNSPESDECYRGYDDYDI